MINRVRHIVMDISSLNMQSSLLAAVSAPLYPFLANQENTEALLTTTLGRESAMDTMRANKSPSPPHKR